MRIQWVLAGVLLLPALAWAQAVPPAEQPRMISVNGEALVNVVPDEVIVQFGVETFNANLDEAKSANDAQSARLTAAIRDSKLIEDKHIQTDHMQIDIVYKSGEYRRGIDGYSARRAYSVVLKDPRQFETLMDLAIKSGANHLMGFEFRTTELRKHRDAARSLAIKAAREKAVALAGDLGCTIGPPRLINEGGGHYGYWGSNWGGRYGGYNAMAQNVMQDMGGGAASGGETMPLGQIGIRANVSVTFDLVPGAAGAR